MARYREGGHGRKGKAEEPEIEVRREKPISRSPRSSSTKQISGSKQPKYRTERQPPRNLGNSQRDESSPVAQFGAAALKRSRGRGDHARGRNRGGGRGARPEKKAVDKASARYEPNGSQPGGANYSIKLESSLRCQSPSRLRRILCMSTRYVYDLAAVAPSSSSPCGVRNTRLRPIERPGIYLLVARWYKSG